MSANKKEKDISSFAGLCSGLAMGYRIRDAVGAKAPGADLSSVSECVFSTLGKNAPGKKLILGALHPDNSGYGYGNNADNDLSTISLLALEGRRIDEVAAALEAAADSISSDEQAEEAAAKALASHICVRYEREGMPGLAFPILGSGFRRSKNRVDGITVKGVSGWTSVFERMGGRRANNRMDRGNDDAVESDNAARGLVAEESQATMVLKTRGDRFQIHPRSPVFHHNPAVRSADSGVYLAGELKPLPKTECPLPCVETIASGAAMIPSNPQAMNLSASFRSNSDDRNPFSQGSSDALAGAGLVWNGFVSRFARSAVCRINGDATPPLGDPLHHILMPGIPLRHAISAASSIPGRKPLVTGQAPSWNNDKDSRAVAPGAVKTLSDDFRSAPLTLCVQLADDILSVPMTDHYGNRYEKREDERLLAAAKKLSDAVDERAFSIANRALAIAGEIQASFISEEGLDEAWSFAIASSGKLPPTAKAVGWALAHPEAAKTSAAADPFVSFCASIARPLGVTAAGDDQAVQVCAALLDQGLSESSIRKLCQTHPEKLTSLAESASKSLPLRGEAKDLQQDRFSLECKLLDAWVVSGTSEDALVIAMEGLMPPGVGNEWAYRSRDTSNVKITDNFADSVPSTMLRDENDAAAMEKRAAAKGRVLPWLLQRMFVRIDETSGGHAAMVEKLRAENAANRWWNPPDHMVISEAKLLARMNGAHEWGPIEWESIDTEKHDWLDVVMRRSPSHSIARREAESDGLTVGLLASAAAAGFGLEASSGNELISIARERLCREWGMTPAGWKSLIKADQSFVETMVKPLFDAEKSRLAARGKNIERSEGASRSAIDAGALQGAWINAAVLLNADMASTIATASMVLGEAAKNNQGLLNMARDWSPSVVRRTHQTEEGASAFLAETRAKKSRLPHVVKAVVERRSAKIKALSADTSWVGGDEFTRFGTDPEKAVVKRAEEDLSGEWDLIADWIARSEEGLWQTLPERPTWKNLWTLQKDWHDLMAATADERVAGRGGRRGSEAGVTPSNPTWPVPLGKLTQGEWVAVEMANGAMLHEEGSAMRHCVSSYAPQCRDGTSRIFSVRFAGKRICTLELRTETGVKFSEGDENSKWKIVQNRGSCNASITDKAALDFCEQVRKAYDAAYSSKIRVAKAEAAKKAKERREALKLKVG